jgi:hypothetical protein
MRCVCTPSRRLWCASDPSATRQPTEQMALSSSGLRRRTLASASCRGSNTGTYRSQPEKKVLK